MFPLKIPTLKPTEYELTESFTVALRFATDAVYGALPQDIMSQFRLEQGGFYGSRSIFGFWSPNNLSIDKEIDKNGDMSRRVKVIFAGERALCVHLKQRHNGDKSKDLWRAVGASYELLDTNGHHHFIVIEPFFFFGKVRTESGIDSCPLL